MTLEEKKAEVIDDFSMYEEWLDKYEYLIELGKNLEAYPESEKTDDKLIKGCQSRVWLDWRVEDGKLWFRADSDAIITRGIISLLISVYSGRTAGEIAGDDFSFIEKIGLKENLSPTRANGLVSMINTIKAAAAENMPKEEAKEEARGGEVLSADDVKDLAPLYENVILALKQVYDPEIPVNIYDMTFTAPNCPMADEVLNDVKVSVEDVPGVKGVNIDLVFEPVWDRSMLSEEARLELGLDDDDVTASDNEENGIH